MAKTRRTTATARRRVHTAGGHVHQVPGVASGPTVKDLSLLAKIFWLAHRNRVELAPAGVAALLWGSAAAFYKSETAGVGMFTAATMAGLAWWAAGKRLDREVEVLYARAVAIVASVWLIAASIVGPMHPVMLWALLIAASGFAVPWYKHKLVRPYIPSPLLGDWQIKWNKIRDRIGLGGSEVVEVEGDENYAEITIQLDGQTYTHVKDHAETIASLLGLPAKAIAIRDMRRVNAGRVKLVYRRTSAIDEIIRWEDMAPLAPKKATDPIVLGRSETGDWKKVGMLAHWMIVGMTRAGKSNELHALMAQITGTYDPEAPEGTPEGTADCLVFFIDLKGGSVAARWKEVIDWIAIDLEGAVEMLEAVKGMIDARGANAPVGEGDGDQLEPSPERPAVFIVFDECSEGLGSSPGTPEQALKTRLTAAAESISRRGAALNFYLVLAGQDGSLQTYGTEKLRGNLSKRMCFRVAKSENAQYVVENYPRLGVTDLEAGQFLYHERVDDPVPIRGPHMTPDWNRKLPQEISKRNARRKPTLDPETAIGGGEAYATRNARRPAKFRLDDTPSSETKVPDETRKDADMENTTPTSAAARAAAIEREAGAGVEPPVTADDLAKVADRIDLAASVEDTTDLFCRLLGNAPRHGVKVQALYETLGMSRTWAHYRVKALEAAGLVANVSHGHYRPLEGVTVEEMRRALEEWETAKRSPVPA